MSQNQLAAYEQAVAIRHRVPGRLRIRVSAIGQTPDRARNAEAALRTLPGVYSVRSNSACGSIVIHHRRSQAPSKSEIAAALAPVIEPLPALSKPLRAPRPAERRRGSPASEQDCVLCQFKLALARSVMNDLWRCWRLDLESRARTGFLAESPTSAARRSAPRSSTSWRERLSLVQKKLTRQVRQIIPFRSERLLALPVLPPDGPH